MPILAKDNYQAPRWLINGHFDTIYPAIFRTIRTINKPEKHTIRTPDNDFFDLNYYNAGSSKTVIISHGLEGNNQRPYVLGMVNAFVEGGWNAIAWSYRGCNGKVNNSIKSYHSGFTEDLIEAIKFANQPKISKIALVGFSLGGNMSLKYLGDNQVNPKISSAVAISVPLDLYDSCMEISKKSNRIYANRFLRTLKQKVKEKSKVFNEINAQSLTSIRDLKTFDDYYTAPLHGFRDAMDYYESCSSIRVLDQIRVPSLILNALNDPFLPDSCYPFDLLRNNHPVFLETPFRGGHVGFYASNNQGMYWSEKRALEFANTMTLE